MNHTNETTTEDVHFLIRLNFVVQPIFYILAILGNSATITAICTCRQMRNTNNVIIVSLAFSDLCVGLNGLSYWIITKAIPGLYVQSFNPHVMSLLQATLITVSILHLLALGLERSIALFSPLRFNEIVNTKFMKLLLSTTWVVGFLLIANILWTMYIGDEGKVRYHFWLYRTVVAYTMYCVVITSLTIISVKTILIVKKKTQALPGLQQSRNSSISKATKRCTVILMAYVITNTPISVASLLMINPQKYIYEIIHIFPLFGTISQSNSFINVIVYCVSSKKYRHAYERLLRNTKRSIFEMCSSE